MLKLLMTILLSCLSHGSCNEFDDVIEEFSCLTNEEAYAHIYLNRIMEPVSNQPMESLGSDQRIDLLQTVQQLVRNLPQKGQVFDVGAGSGDVVSFALQLAPSGTVVNIEEPNAAFIEKYLEKLSQYNHLKVGVVYNGYLQDYYRGDAQGILPDAPQNLILALHMIYHLTDFMQASIDPEKDLIDAISFLYEQLAPGGSIMIVYADLFPYPEKRALCSLGEQYYRTFYPDQPYADHLLHIYSARNHLLGPNGTIATELSKCFPDTHPQFDAQLRQTHFFGRTLADIAVLGLAGELCPSDTNPFDINKLKFCIDFVQNNQELIDLQKETRPIPQQGFWRVAEPQVIAVIKKPENDPKEKERPHHQLNDKT